MIKGTQVQNSKNCFNILHFIISFNLKIDAVTYQSYKIIVKLYSQKSNKVHIATS